MMVATWTLIKSRMALNVFARKFISLNHKNYFGSTNKLMTKRLVRELSSLSSSMDERSKALLNAEKIVGYPTSYLNLRCLLSDEMSNIALLVRKIVGTGHPLLKTIKNLIYNGKHNVQTRGLIVLLLSKAANNLQEIEAGQITSYGVMQGQRSLAEIVEMVHMAFQIHKGVINIQHSSSSDATVQQDMHFGNKIAVLCGDYLLANACTSLAALRNTQVIDLIATSISHFTEAEFMEKRDEHGRNILDDDHTINDWIEKNTLAVGSLMGNSCKAALSLANHDERTKEIAYQFGKNVALAWQAHTELQTFIDDDRFPPGTPLDLTSAPILFHYQNNPGFKDYCQSTIDYKQIRELVLAGDSIEKTQDFYQNLIKAALEALQYFSSSDAKSALQDLLHAL